MKRHMKTQEAKELGVRIATLAQAGQMTQAYALLAPVLAERTPFPLLGHIGESIGDDPLEIVNALLEHVGSGKTEGGWVVIGSGLKTQLGRDLSGAFTRCRGLIIAWLVYPISQLLAGPLADQILEPAMAEGGKPGTRVRLAGRHRHRCRDRAAVYRHRLDGGDVRAGGLPLPRRAGH